MYVNESPTVAVIGAGWMGETHLRCYAKQGIRVVGIADPMIDKARALADRYGVDNVYASPHALFEDLRPTGVSITSPEDHHVEPTVIALDRGIGVLVEKPIANNLADAARIFEAAERSSAPLVPAHVLRFAAPYRALREQIAHGDIGGIVGITARRDRTVVIGGHYAHVHPAFLTMVHDIDQVLWITGSDFVRIRALEHRPTPDSQADLLLVQGELGNGVIVSLVTGILHPEGMAVATSDRFEVYGSAGVASVDMSNPPVIIYGKRSHAPDWILDPADCSGAFGAEIAHFVDCLRRQTPSDIVTPEDALSGLRVMDGIVRSISAGGADIRLQESRHDADS